MAEFLETSDKSYSLYETISSGSGENEFEFPVTIRQFTVMSEVNGMMTWQNNSGSIPIFDGDILSIPCRAKTITITPATTGLVRIIGIN